MPGVVSAIAPPYIRGTRDDIPPTLGAMTTRSVLSAQLTVRALVAIALTLALAACGGDDDSTDAPSAIDDASDVASGDADESGGEASDSNAAPTGFDLPDDLPLADGLIPELATIPVPEGVAFGVGSAYTADQDPRETAIQQVFFTIPADEVAAYYLDELPAEGFTLESGGGSISDQSEIVVADQQYMIRFTTPDGLPGQVFVQAGLLSPAQININVYRSGTR
jgi:hypothetical protein